MSMHRFCTVLTVALLPLVASCDELFGLCDYETDPTCEDPERAQVEGTVTVPAAGQAAGAGRTLHPVAGTAYAPLAAAIRGAMSDALHAQKVAAPGKHPALQQRHSNHVTHPKAAEETFRAGEALVKTREPMRKRKAELAAAIAHFLDDGTQAEVRLCGAETRCMVELRTAHGKPLDAADTTEAVQRLNAAPFLRYAERNLILQMALQPNDEFFSYQWHYQAIDLVSAWDITTGDPSLVAAIVDTGILVDHADLAARVINGADLIDDSGAANDGDGRDMDGFDPGDDACGDGCHSYHGTHVAGTIGAVTNNGTMVSGITWSGSLMPVRALGKGGGALSDIADAIVWAAGYDVDGVDPNPTPADVINLSLGGRGESQFMADAVADAVDAGAIVVVAAGNDDEDANAFTPANVPAAITVAAVGNTGATRARPLRASYSNYGPDVDVAAPGGEQSEDIDDDGQGDGVLSTLGDFVDYYQGTSMATPHVAGIAMLLKSIDPTLTQDEVLTALQSSANPNITCPEGCGAGAVTAAGALLALDDGLTGARVLASPSVVRVGADTFDAVVTFKNLGHVDTTVTLLVGGPDRGVVEIDSTGGALPASGSLTVQVTIDRTGADRGEATITASSASGDAEARVVWSPDVLASLLSVDVGAVQIRDDGSLNVARLVEATPLSHYGYKLFNLDPGTYLVVGLVDTNNNGSYDDNADAIGIFLPSNGTDGTACTQAGCGEVTVAAGDHLRNADFVVSAGFNPGDGGTGGTGDGPLGAPCTTGADCAGGLYCEAHLPGGYCTTDCTSDSSCPSAGLCFTLDDGSSTYQVCLASCSNTADCDRSDGYICDSDSTCYPG